MKHNKKKKSTYGRRPGNKPSARARTRPIHERRSAHKRSDNKHCEGIYTGTKQGYGFVETADLAYDIFIPAGRECGALDGDTVAVSYHTYTDNGALRTEGEVTHILEVGRTAVIGTVYEEMLVGYGRRHAPRLIVEPSDARFSRELILRDADGVRSGDKVEIILPPRGTYRGEELYCTLKRNFGRADSREANYAAILTECGIEVPFEEEVLKEAARVAEEVIHADGRTDRRGEIIFTIDGAGAKDLDDAVSLSRTDHGWLLGVHIADVSHYVAPKSALERSAIARGTSVYFTDKVVPMLPVALSNGACSLNAGEDKYAMTCEMEIFADGTLGNCKMERSLIRSCVRGVYTEVNDLFQNHEDSPFYEKYKEVYPTLMEMHRLYLVLAEKSRRRGALDLEQREAEILLDETGFPTDIVPRVRGDAEKLIEQFMLAANESVATTLHTKELPCVYRVHERPNKEKLAEFVTFVHNMGFDASYVSGKDPAGCDFSRLLDAAKEQGVGEAISYTLLRSMAKARYSEFCTGHFGLGIDRYCHFTSPIRRLSDLATHRMIGEVLLGGDSAKKYVGYAHRTAEAASETELRALTAERRIDALYKTLYLTRHIGEEYSALVSSVTRFGVFAMLDNTCEGLIPMGEIPGAWFFDEGNMCARSGEDCLRIGDRITIRVEEADVSRGKVRFSLSGMPEGTPAPTPQERVSAQIPPAKRTPKKTVSPTRGQTSKRGKPRKGKR